MSEEATFDRKDDGTFAPGSGGRRRGTRNRVTVAIEALLEGDADKLTRKAIDLALAGDTTALRLCLERLAPARRDRTIEFDLPPVVTAADHPPALAAILAGAARGEITPQEGQALAMVLEQHRRSIEVVEIESRIAALEAGDEG